MVAKQPHPACLNAAGEWDRRRAAQYRKKLTRKIRLAVYQRDGWTCQLCGLEFEPTPDGYAPCISVPPPRYRITLEIDHIVPVRLGGTHDLKNLRALCQPCNGSKGSNGQRNHVINVRADNPKLLVASLRRELTPAALAAVVDLLTREV